MEVEEGRKLWLSAHNVPFQEKPGRAEGKPAARVTAEPPTAPKAEQSTRRSIKFNSCLPDQGYLRLGFLLSDCTHQIRYI